MRYRKSLTWRIKEQAQKQQAAVIMITPLIGSCWIAAVVDWILVLSWVQGSTILGPFTSVMIIAPPTVTNVPKIFAWLCNALIFTLSSLQKPQPFSFSNYIKNYHLFGSFLQLFVKPYIGSNSKNIEKKKSHNLL